VIDLGIQLPLGRDSKGQDAITWYGKVLAVDPNDTFALYGKGLALFALGKYEEAITWYDKALAIDPNYSYAQNNKKEALSKLNDSTIL
jgi:tetratricopeptide (TPR) repeat protein